MAQNTIEIDCHEVWPQISNYLDNEMDPGLRATLSSHFRGCAHCSAVLDGVRNVVRLVGDGRIFEIPHADGQSLFKKLNDHLTARRCRG